MIVFAFPEQAELVKAMECEQGIWEWRHFPDGESYVRVDSDIKGKSVSILCSLNQPDAKVLPLIFLACALKEKKAAKVTLIAPYLGYMRQDTCFIQGEAVTADIFGGLLSPYIDAIVTIDPHLHRHHAMEEIYSCECKILSAVPLMVEWIRENIKNPLLIGPDMESEQWVRNAAANINAPYIILRKTRHGDRDVDIELPDMDKYRNHTVVLVDDIISTAGTMIKTLSLLKARRFEDIICVATHGLFAGNAYNELYKAGAVRIITANTLPHSSNGLEIAGLLLEQLC